LALLQIKDGQAKAVEPPARNAATFGGGRDRISTLRQFGRLRAGSVLARMRNTFFTDRKL
jgi:hypothetical protein